MKDLVESQGHPVFDHRCQKCNYLGSTTIDGEVYDGYFCENGIPSYLVRYSSEEGDYVSLPTYLTPALGNFEPYKTIIGLHDLR